MSAATFEQLSKRPIGRPRTLCARCGETDNAGDVRIEVRKKHPGAKPISIASRSASFCETCAVEVFEAAVRKMEVKR